ncbi:MAG: nucleotide-binding protein [Acidobacteria bacterium]|nr:nucleotide-binding protein [Acidobacteriota bacterium]MCA1637723.1 nucleotide-binding protein [Acidobacteriota bacterium]
MSDYVFVGHRYSPLFMDSFRKAVKFAFESHREKLKIKYADERFSMGHILEKHIQPMIDDALFCVFDISEVDKPNVFIELGYAYGRNKYVVLTSMSKQTPTDLAGLVMIFYDSFSELEDKLLRHMSENIEKARSQNDTNRLATLNIESILDERKTELLFELHKASLADRIDPVVNRFLRIIEDNRDNYEFEILFEHVNAAINRSRNLIRGFYSQIIGDVYEFVKENFTEDNLREILKKKIEPIVLKNIPLDKKRIELFQQIRIDEERVFDDFLIKLKKRALNLKNKKRK